MTPQTVLGHRLATDYDVVLAHEHLLIDIRAWADTEHPLFPKIAHQRVDASSLPDVQQNPFACFDNLLLDHEDVAADELGRLAGVKTLLVDVTPDHLGGNAAQLARLSQRTGVDIVRGCGAYVEESWPEDFGDLTAGQFSDRIRAQFESDRPPSVIGEIGTGAPMSDSEALSLAGAAAAQGELDVPLYVHLHPWQPDGVAALDLVERSGGDLARTVLCHMDVTTPRALDKTEELLQRGCYVAFDIWGDEFVYGDVSMPSDLDRAHATAELVARGWGHKIVHSQDVCTKSQLRRWGGPGYSHIPENVPFLLEAEGLTADDIGRQLSHNALSLLGVRGSGFGSGR